MSNYEHVIKWDCSTLELASLERGRHVRDKLNMTGGHRRMHETRMRLAVKPLTVLVGPRGSGKNRIAYNVHAPGEAVLHMEEPEYGAVGLLDAAEQMGVARAVSFAVNEGQWIVMTTCSDYILKELNSLIMLGEPFRGRKGFLKRYPEYRGLALDKDKVAAYQCDPLGGVIPCEVDNRGMNLPYIDSLIDHINKISNELANHLEDV